MSYCRANGKDSDVYVIATVIDGKEAWQCVGCDITDEGYNKTVYTRTKMITHLTRHRGLGHKVPARAVERLQKERREIDAG